MKKNENEKRNKIIARSAVVLVILCLIALAYWLFFLKNKVSTDDAYVNGYTINLTSEVSGAVIGVYVESSDFVKKDTLLVQLDKTNYELLLEKAKVDLKLNPTNESARFALREAFINLKRTSIYAPVDGFIAKRTIEVGKFINPQDPLLTIVSLDNIWVDANFKETQLNSIRVGQPVEMVSELYGNGVIFRGKVLGVVPGSGSVFSLLPPQNATGNWIKVIQRVTVRISLDADQIKKHPLLLGLSMHVTVDVSDTSGLFLKDISSNKTVVSTDIYKLSKDYVDDFLKSIKE